MILEEIEEVERGEAAYTLAEWLEISAECARLRQENQRLRDALMMIAEGRGTIKDHSTVYMNGKVALALRVYNRSDMRAVAEEALKGVATLPQT